MGYKLLGFIVWQGIRLYLRNSGKGNVVKAGLAGVGALADRGRGGSPVARRSNKTSSAGLPARVRGGQTRQGSAEDPAKPPDAATGTRSAGRSDLHR